MRRSWAVLPIAGFILAMLCVAWPALASLESFSRPPSASASQSVLQLFASSLCWGAGVSICAVVLGWAPGRVLGRLVARRGFAAMAVAMLLPVCLPAYLVFYAWWQAWPPDGALFSFLASCGAVELARWLTLGLGLICWSWPIVAWVVAGGASQASAIREDMLALDGAGWRERLADCWRCDREALLIGAAVVFLITFTNTTSFDLAQVYTIGNELRAMEALGATPADLLRTSWPVLAGVVGAAALIWWSMSGINPQTPSAVRRPTRVSLGLTLGLLGLTTALPMGLLFASVMRSGGPARIGEFASFYCAGLGNGLLVALLTGLGGAFLAIGAMQAWMSGRRGLRRLATLSAMMWLAGAAVPASLVVTAYEAAFNRAGFDWLYHSGAIVPLGHITRFGIIGVLVGRWMAMHEPANLRDQRLLDGGVTLPSMIRTARPRIVAGSGAAFVITAILSMGEIAVAAGVRPAGFDMITSSLLNDMHYQRPQTVVLVALVMMILALMAAVGAVFLWRLPQRRYSGLAALACFFLIGCGDDPSPDTAFEPRRMFGAAGEAPGQFNYPRGISVDPSRQRVFVVDKGARVQRFDLEGNHELEWRMPEKANGKPTGLSVAPDGTVWVADTHYWRVIQYDPEGNELRRFGSFGREPGQFIYPTDIAFGADGRVYVSEYGGNDRIQVFAADGRWQSEFGSFGAVEPTGLQFDRPQSMDFNADGSELFIADACHHRIVVADPEGDVLRVFGSPGREPGQLSYPYDVFVMDDGTIMVAEFGNNRVQRFTPEGRSLGVYGRIGFGPGELQYPWGVDGAGSELFVLDSGNNRVQVMRRP